MQMPWSYLQPTLFGSVVWALNLPTRTKKKMTVQTILKDLIAYANELTNLGAEREARAVVEFLNRVKAQI